MARVGLREGRARARYIESDSAPPPSADVVVIGGGFVGTCTALTLAERGISVAVCEKGVIAGEASGRSMGYVDSQMLDPVKFELVSRSKQLWSELNSRTGLDTGYRCTGLLQAMEGPAIGAAEEWVKAVEGVPGMRAQMLSGQELAELLPGMIDPPQAALYTPDDACAEPKFAAPAIAEAARRKGARILQGCAVRGLETRGGRVSRVVTERGPIDCQSVIVAAGSWSPQFLRSIGVSVPQLNVFMSMMGLSGVTAGPVIPFSAGAYGFRPQIDGQYTFGAVAFAAPIELATLRHLTRLLPAIRSFWPQTRVGFSLAQFWRELSSPSSWPLDRPTPFEARRIQEPQFREDALTAGLTQLQRHFPAFRTAQICDRWSGVISSTPDNMPIIGALPGHPGVYVGTALTFGLTMGPGAGEALADLATGRTPSVNLHEYRFERFTDGTPIVFRG